MTSLESTHPFYFPVDFILAFFNKWWIRVNDFLKWFIFLLRKKWNVASYGAEVLADSSQMCLKLIVPNHSLPHCSFYLYALRFSSVLPHLKEQTPAMHCKYLQALLLHSPFVACHCFWYELLLFFTMQISLISSSIREHRLSLSFLTYSFEHTPLFISKHT